MNTDTHIHTQVYEQTDNLPECVWLRGGSQEASRCCVAGEWSDSTVFKTCRQKAAVKCWQ